MTSQHTNRVSILVIIPSLHTGGSERVIMHLVRNLDRTKFAITLLVLKKEGVLQHMIPDDIETIYFNFARTSRAIFSIIKLIWSRRPDIVLSTLGHLNLLVASSIPVMPSKTAYVARESNIISIRNKDERYPKLFNFLFKTVYNRFTKVICQSEVMQNDLVDNFGVKYKKTVLINNPVDFSILPVPSWAFAPHEKMQLISVGQLRPEKGYPRILRMLSELDVPFEYKIIGGGAMEADLRAMVEELGLTDKVTFLGSLPNPFSHLVQADCMLLGSYYEGFPNAVIEAHACGVPVLAWRSSGGTAEIIRDGVNGWMASGTEQLLQLLRERAFAKLDKQSIVDSARSRYDLPHIIRQYEKELLAAYQSKQ